MLSWGPHVCRVSTFLTELSPCPEISLTFQAVLFEALHPPGLTCSPKIPASNPFPRSWGSLEWRTTLTDGHLTLYGYSALKRILSFRYSSGIVSTMILFPIQPAQNSYPYLHYISVILRACGDRGQVAFTHISVKAGSYFKNICKPHKKIAPKWPYYPEILSIFLRGIKAYVQEKKKTNKLVYIPFTRRILYSQKPEMRINSPVTW